MARRLSERQLEAIQEESARRWNALVARAEKEFREAEQRAAERRFRIHAVE